MLVETENLTFAELKSKRSELIAEAERAPIKELAARYVKARTDAKMRDEKMGEQGRRIADLESMLEAERASSKAVLKTKDAEIAKLKEAK